MSTSSERPLALVTGASSSRVMPDSVKAELHRKMAEPGSA